MAPAGRRTLAFAIGAVAALFCRGSGERSGAVFNGSSLTLATSDSSFFFFQGVRYRVAYFHWSDIDSQVTLDGRVVYPFPGHAATRSPRFGSLYLRIPCFQELVSAGKTRDEASVAVDAALRRGLVTLDSLACHVGPDSARTRSVNSALTAFLSKKPFSGIFRTAALSPDGEILYSTFDSQQLYTAHCQPHSHEKAMSYLRNIAGFFSADDGTPRMFIVRTGGDVAMFGGETARAILRQIERVQTTGKAQDGPLSEDWLQDFQASARHMK